MEKSIREQLHALADENYKTFSAALIPNIDNMLGVRLPVLRKLAKEIAKDDWRAYLDPSINDYFEEVMLQGMIIGYVNTDVEEILHYIEKFVPQIDNWSLCDSFCAGLKFTRSNKQRVWDFLLPYFETEKEYDIRFGVVMLLNYYLDEAYLDKVFQLLNRIRHEGYYAKMAVAWAISIAYTKFPERTLTFLHHNDLDDMTYNKALQKMLESYRVDKHAKEMIRAMKR
ncbi:DNA alkylation repair protein [Paenibacillus sp. GCM10027627]|uniref:DNA alkylation repair protein n=1 Tax=unclassified Paenibacillus TaxID=185978 RepID=UPI0036428C61